MHGDVDGACEERFFEFAGEEAFAAGFAGADEREVELLVAAGDEGFHLDLQPGKLAEQRRAREFRLRERERACPRAEDEARHGFAPPETASEYRTAAACQPPASHSPNSIACRSIICSQTTSSCRRMFIEWSAMAWSESMS